MEKIYTIGSSENNEIIIRNKYISRLHARLILAGQETFLLEDFSTNGTFVNGKKVHNRKVEVRREDQILFAGKEPLNWSLIFAETKDTPKKNLDKKVLIMLASLLLVSVVGLAGYKMINQDNDDSNPVFRMQTGEGGASGGGNSRYRVPRSSKPKETAPVEKEKNQKKKTKKESNPDVGNSKNEDKPNYLPNNGGKKQPSKDTATITNEPQKITPETKKQQETQSKSKESTPAIKDNKMEKEKPPIKPPTEEVEQMTVEQKTVSYNAQIDKALSKIEKEIDKIENSKNKLKKTKKLKKKKGNDTSKIDIKMSNMDTEKEALQAKIKVLNNYKKQLKKYIDKKGNVSIKAGKKAAVGRLLYDIEQVLKA